MLPPPDYKVQSDEDGLNPDGTRRPARQPKPEEPSLFNLGEHSASTRADAARAARPKHSARRKRALTELAKVGSKGHTRESLGIAMGLRVQSVCSIALDLLRSGDAAETGERRKTSLGSPAAVFAITDAGMKSVPK